MTTVNFSSAIDEQVVWAYHGHTQCVHNTHLLGDLGHAPAMEKKLKIIHSEIVSEAVVSVAVEDKLRST